MVPPISPSFSLGETRHPRGCCGYLRIAFPRIVKRQVARSAGVRFGRGVDRGRVRGFDPSESTIWGRMRLVSASLDAGAGAICEGDVEGVEH